MANINDDSIKKDQDFLGQIPEWEKDYKESDKEYIDFEKEEWKDAPATFTEHDLKIFGQPVMEDWEDDYMRELANIASSHGGVVLELGYGMGISARYIQKNKIEKHIIIEANHDVAEKAREFAKTATYPVEVMEGFWEEEILKIPDESIDGILFDTYPLSEKELYQNHFFFFPFAYQKLKTGGIFTYYSDEVEKFSDVHLKKLQEAGFKLENINGKPFPVTPPADCEYWKDSTMLAPNIVK